MRKIVVCLAVMLALPGASRADSVYDLNIMGRDVVPAAGIGHLLAGASVANPDVGSAYTTSPAASALTDNVVITFGMVHHTTRTSYTERALAFLGPTYEYEGAGSDIREESSATTTFPCLSVIIPLRVVNIFTGYFVEKMGRADLTATGTAYGNVLFDARYTKESSVFSIPVMVSAAYKGRLALSGGLMFSYLDSREERDVDFRSEIVGDITDAVDMYATGTSLAFGALLDYDFIRVGCSIRSGCDMSGNEEFSTDAAGIWSSNSVDISAPGCYKVGAALASESFTLEMDYETSPWSEMKLGEEYISVNRTYRYAFGISYSGRHLWDARKAPLHAGFYTQPLDRRVEESGETSETGYIAGTSLDLADGRATVVLGLEYIRRKTDGEPDLHEEAYGISLSLSVGEAWRSPLR